MSLALGTLRSSKPAAPLKSSVLKRPTPVIPSSTAPSVIPPPSSLRGASTALSHLVPATPKLKNPPVSTSSEDDKKKTLNKENIPNTTYHIPIVQTKKAPPTTAPLASASGGVNIETSKVKGYSELKKSEELLILENKKLGEQLRTCNIERDLALQQAVSLQNEYRLDIKKRDDEIYTLKEKVAALQAEQEQREVMVRSEARETSVRANKEVELVREDLKRSQARIAALERKLEECGVDVVSLKSFSVSDQFKNDAAELARKFSSQVQEISNSIRSREEPLADALEQMRSFRLAFEVDDFDYHFEHEVDSGQSDMHDAEALEKDVHDEMEVVDNEGNTFEFDEAWSSESSLVIADPV